MTSEMLVSRVTVRPPIFEGIEFWVRKYWLLIDNFFDTHTRCTALPTTVTFLVPQPRTKKVHIAKTLMNA
jgi:hypothetical protein